MDMKKLFLTAVATATPYDVVYNKSEFQKVILSNPVFEKQFREELTPDILREAREKGWYFIFDTYHGQRAMFHNKDHIRLSLIGFDKLPTISLSHYQK